MTWSPEIIQGGQLPPGGPGGPSLEARVAKVEADIQNVKENISDIKTDLREIRKEMRGDFRLLFASIVTATLGLAGLIANGFGWFS